MGVCVLRGRGFGSLVVWGSWCRRSRGLCFASCFLMEGGGTTPMDEEVRELLARLEFFDEEEQKIVSQSKMESGSQG